MSGTAAILGAGVVGLACARALQGAGFAVTVVDRGPPGEAASLGNAGHLGTASIIPQATPGIWRQVPRMLADRTSPLAVRPGYLAANLPWFLRFLAAGRREVAERGAEAMAALLARVQGSWAPLLADAGAGGLVDPRAGLMHAFRSREALRAASWAYDLRRRLGIPAEELDGDAARAIEPCLGPEVKAAVWLPEVGIVRDPLGLSRAIAARIEAAGGRFLRAEATGVDARGIATRDGRLDADVTVIAAGAWSARLASPLGAAVPLVAERGYHVMLEGSNAPVRTALLLAERRVTVTPMRGGLRLATMAEFAAPDAPPDHDRAAAAFAGAEAWVPGLGGRVASRWVGPRPSTPDSRPVIGRAPRAPNVILAFGHGHLGLTLAALTGEVVANLARGRPAGIDLGAVSPTRFGGGLRRAA
jgi:D-amino-acid dehydrogenase